MEIHGFLFQNHEFHLDLHANPDIFERKAKIYSIFLVSSIQTLLFHSNNGETIAQSKSICLEWSEQTTFPMYSFTFIV